MDFLKDTKNVTHLNALMTPYLLKELYENLEKSRALSNFLEKSSHNHSWTLVSDYCIGDPKKQDVLTFMLFPTQSFSEFNEISSYIKDLQPKDIKHSKNINPEFLKFISENPFFNISYILDGKRNLITTTEHEKIYFRDRLQSIQQFYFRLAEINNIDPNDIPYYKDLTRLSNLLSSKNLSLNLLRDIDLISQIVSSIFTLISKKNFHHEKMIFAWVSDKDKLITYQSKNLNEALIFNMIISTFYSHNNYSRKLINHDTTKESKFDFDNFNRVADVVAGALSTYFKPESEITKKAIQVVNGFICDITKNHITKIHRLESLLTLTNINISKCE